MKKTSKPLESCLRKLKNDLRKNEDRFERNEEQLEEIEGPLHITKKKLKKQIKNIETRLEIHNQ